MSSYYTQKRTTEIRLKEIKPKIKEIITEKKERKTAKDYRNHLQWTQNKLDEMQEIFDKTTLLLKNIIPKSEEHYIMMWEKISLNQAYESLEFDDSFREQITNFKSIINKLLNDSQESFQEINMYQDLINVLEQYKNLNISMSGLEIPIAEFSNSLKESMKRKENLVRIRDNIKESIELLDQLKRQAEDLEEKYFSKIRELKKKLSNSDYNSENEKIESDFQKLQDDLKKYEEKFKFYDIEFTKRDLESHVICKIGEGELEKYSLYTSEPQIQNEISKLKEEIMNKKAQHSKYNFNIKNLLNEIDALQNKKPHEYENYLDELNKLLEITTILKTKFNKDFNKYISEIKTLKTDDANSLHEEQSKYYDALFSYLGKRVDMIRHIDHEYKVEKIDLINRIITTKEGKNIMLLDMGTGQGQCAYLKGLLNSPDNKPIIALFDEIAMMDSITLEPIKEKFRELYNTNRLLVGIVAQKADKVIISKI